uniref:Coiled-coil domain-containing protein 89 n=1 Tax=Knipowitschia caucasica TaxID=637954 RepID=A0AAV2K052_KNICA
MDQATMNNETCVEDFESMRLALEKLSVSPEGAGTDVDALRCRVDQQSTLISILKNRTDELLLRCQALQKINSELEETVTDTHKELEDERKNYETLEKRFMDLAANNEAIIKLQDKEASVQLLAQEIKQLKENYAQKEHKYSENIKGLEAKCLEQKNEFEAKEKSLIEKLRLLEEKQRISLVVCDDLKVQLIDTREEYTSKNTSMMESITALRKEKDHFLQISVERGKLIQEKQEDLNQMQIKLREEKKLRTKAEERFKQESQLVNADARVKTLQKDLDESTTKYQKLKKDFEAFKEHSTNLLIHERELNKKLRLMTG